MALSLRLFRLTKFRRKFGIFAPRVVVRAHYPWPWLVLGGVFLFVLLALLAWLFVQRIETGVLGAELEALRGQVRLQKDELLLLHSSAGTGKSAVAIERTAQQELVAKIHALEAENVGLKEDILTLERLLPFEESGAPLHIENFRIVPGVGRGFRYRMLLTYQSDKSASGFRGGVQLGVSDSLSGEQRQLNLPADGKVGGFIAIELRRFSRYAGEFELPEGAELVAVEARLVQGGKVLARQLGKLQG